MKQGEKEYIAKLQAHAAGARALFSNPMKSERERMIVRAFLRCIGEQFSDAEIRTGKEEPVDVEFQAARFQVRETLGGRKRGLDWLERERRYQVAKSIADTAEPFTASEPMSLDEMSQLVAEGLAEKASHYGAKNCAKLDALVYVDLRNRHLWPLKPAPNDKVTRHLNEQGWQSVSVLSVPYGAILFAQPTAPDFLRNKAGSALNQWPHCDGWFDT
jgi:hypothetical protein